MEQFQLHFVANQSIQLYKQFEESKWRFSLSIEMQKII